MHSIRRLALTLLLTVTPVGGVHAAVIDIHDAEGNRVQLVQPAKRIVSLAPHITELLFAAGAGSVIVGTVDYSDFPSPALVIPRVGGYDNVDLERIIALKPDLVVAWHGGNSTRQINRLRSLGLPIFVLGEPRELEDIARDLERLGLLAGSEAQARTAAADFRERVRRLTGDFSGRSRVDVFYQIWSNPLMTVNGEHLISRIIRLCGGHNVFEDLLMLTPVIGVESILRANPEAIIAGGMDENSPAWLQYWQRYPSLRAAREGKLFFVSPDLLQRNGPRILDGTEQICQALEQARAHR